MTIELPPTIDSALCDSNCVRLLRGVSADEISAMVDDGKILFAFDVATRVARKGRAAVRELRFWFSEVATPQFTARLSIDEVINRIVPRDQRWLRGSEICQLLLISRVTLRLIARQLGAVIRNRAFQISRKAFAAWLRARWLGGQNS